MDTTSTCSRKEQFRNCKTPSWHGANVNALYNTGGSPLHYAIALKLPGFLSNVVEL
ncbi:hypothetical protein TVAG_073740 [Trichomonas vaginalis G3]|uniref:Ankyrin repeat protein n=1 Tax=Trichomonas vaginalis (strain ATCC PRA-98 / G3) TaxID=412133 RepID=A2EEB0_TRIV3|nr:hypothetical protein TVAGG3_0797750 [Trichomonas vaginalis G3]EAY09008.1 hypothetical protein TVAG_073740 [Trichomonas vaginalis G3]KAI5496283.1 hypothetical protein TVAGG3_0797750 [Trichomonas vaginalis G3]|eukprot:XP_001321231.1 hypothetical protein [Trichomonas vaginalis G3]